MNKPASELIALADELAGWHDCADGDVNAGNGHFRLQCISDSDQQRLNLRAVLREASKALRLAAGQSGSERAGVDALRTITWWLNEIEACNERMWNGSRATYFGHIKKGVEIIRDALATPPAQPEPPATHDKPDGAVRGKPVDASTPYPSLEAMKAAVELEIRSALGSVQTVVIGKLIQQAIDATLHSHKIAAAETGPGDAIGLLHTYALNFIGTLPEYARQDAMAKVDAAIDRLDVKAEAKSQEPDAVAWRVRSYLDQCEITSRAEIATDWRTSGLDVEPLYTHPTTKPEAPAVSVDAIRAALSPFIGRESRERKEEYEREEIEAAIRSGGKQP